MQQCALWTGAAITFSVDDLQMGTCVYTCVVNDTLGRQGSSDLIVTVEAPPRGEGLPITTLLIIGGSIAAVAIIAGVLIMLRRRGT